MKIAIVGPGNVGRALAGAWQRAGHDVVFGSREAGRSVAGLPALPPDEAAALAPVVVLALPWAVAGTAVAALGPLTGKVVIDCMNPLAMGPGGLALAIGHGTSGGEIVQGWLPGARVVKTLNQTGADVMADARRFGARPAMFMAGDDADAKATAGRLLADIGFEALDAGDITRSRILEPLAMVWINQAMTRGKGRDWAFGVLLPAASA